MSLSNRRPNRRHNRIHNASRSTIQSLEKRIVLSTLPANFTENLMGGITGPTAAAFAPDGRLFVTTQPGQIRVIDHGVLQATPFATITTTSFFERGLLGIAFDPDYFNNHYVYIYYTVPTAPVHNRVSRLTADPNNENLMLAGSETILLELNTLNAGNHNGGGIHFGPDGKLYMGVGENAVGSNAQSFNNLLGKMLRMNKDGSIPTDNPYFNDVNVTGQNKLIWSLGLRNPFTFAFQRGTGRMFINDVGQDTWEEINDGIAHRNYGWPGIEGFRTTQTPPVDYMDPLYVYQNTGSQIAIIGGEFYNPIYASYPATYVNKYFFADLGAGWIRTLDFSGTPTATDFATGASSVRGFAMSPDGSIVYLQGGGTQGAFRVKYLDTTAPTVASTSFVFNEAKPTFGTAQRLRISFSEYVGDSLTPSDLTITNLTTGQVIPTANITMQYDASTNTANFSFPGYADVNGVLPDGNYQVTATAASITDITGNALSSGVNFQFYALNGDFNRDRHVDSLDQAIINGNQGNNGTYTQGDMNYNGAIDATDLALFNPNLALWLPIANTPAALPATGANDAFALRIESPILVDAYTGTSASGSPAFRIYVGATGAANAITFDGLGGNDTLAIIGTAGANSVTFNNGSISFGAPVNATYSNTEAIVFDGAGGGDTLIVNGGPLVSIQNVQHLASFDINNTASAEAAAGGAALIVTQALSFDAGATLDLNDNDLIWNYTGGRGSILFTVEQMIATARNGGAWDGGGLTSSDARDDSNHDTTLGAIEATDFKLGNPNATTFDGEPIDNSAVLVKYTYYGDTDFNGKVDGSDYARVDATFNQETALHADIGGWFNGDFDYNHKVDGADYALIDGAFNSQGGPLRPSAGFPALPDRSRKIGIGLARR